MRSSPLLQHLNDGEEEDEERLQAVIECRRLLLQAGADPTIPNNEGNEILEECLSEGTAVSTCYFSTLPAFTYTTRIR